VTSWSPHNHHPRRPEDQPDRADPLGWTGSHSHCSTATSIV